MSSKPTQAVSARYRWMVACQVLAATLGGYALASLFAAMLALALPVVAGVSRAASVLVATLLAFAFYTAVAIWVFSTRSAMRAWAGLVIGAAVFGVVFIALRGAA
ncbi:DUF3649 domain-containing protein [Cupriavidus basilensis]|uniref:DUF3649 domain-containing protein n=1 Tax=Cupriavidus basilensis TaxID=68895 RepID=A0A7M2H3T8_9BURK|nr:DUF3649 domain-containing protein [Cupriavidus basilensis]QOT79215.1 DUF3649 domain-containing protein [Cupriavidus basilensis]